ncbi:O-methyltransferase [Parafrankia elaeagni]|uniref:O-methyltransferase n=1 Tax=Parafrankia elaeagni TaxID=222534 RepID=UPI00037D180E|nr:O-methyltransferase [Parafrankia elaeagni]
MTDSADVAPTSGNTDSGKSGFLPPALRGYLVAHGSPPDDILVDLAAETAALGDAGRMQIPAEQGALLTILTAALAPSRAIEIGTFTGYSSLCTARGLPPGGRLLCLDVNDEWTSVARRYWERAGVSDRVELRLGPAAESLAALPEEPTFDLAFIDADKQSYPAYFELLLPRMNTNGLIIVDNVLQSGRVLDEEDAEDSPNVLAIRGFNAALAVDARVQVVVLPVADGLTIARKLP